MNKNKIFTPPYGYDNGVYTIDGVKPLNLFLGGTIDCGDSVNHQQAIIDELNKEDTIRPIMVYNPRREEWQSSDNKDENDKQINWELYHLERADLIVMNILEDSKSPISLMEIGLFARTNKLIVFCKQGFYRFDNVRIVCKRYNVPLYETNDISFIKDKILDFSNKNSD